jgi:hypothetical protein
MQHPLQTSIRAGMYTCFAHDIRDNFIDKVVTDFNKKYYPGNEVRQPRYTEAEAKTIATMEDMFQAMGYFFSTSRGFYRSNLCSVIIDQKDKFDIMSSETPAQDSDMVLFPKHIGLIDRVEVKYLYDANRKHNSGGEDFYECFPYAIKPILNAEKQKHNLSAAQYEQEIEDYFSAFDPAEAIDDDRFILCSIIDGIYMDEVARSIAELKDEHRIEKMALYLADCKWTCHEFGGIVKPLDYPEGKVPIDMYQDKVDEWYAWLEKNCELSWR